MAETKESLLTKASVADSSGKLPRSSMKALQKDGNTLSVLAVPKPQLQDEQSVVIRVLVAGLCRTDIYAAEGKIKVCNPLVLGHELCGIVDQIGSDVEGIHLGQRVTVNPLLPCHNCVYCNNGTSHSCQHTTFLGVDCPGCFAEFVHVPSSAVYAIPEGISDITAAYTEPIAASLAVLKAGIKKDERGLIYGKNRFSQLLQKILQAKQFTNIDTYDPLTKVDEPHPDSFDYVIETSWNTGAIKDMVRAIKPGGKIILKSRHNEPLSFHMMDLLKKEPVFHVVHYGSFDEALDLIKDSRIVVEDLVDGVYKLEDFKKVLATASMQEALKPFFAPWKD